MGCYLDAIIKRLYSLGEYSFAENNMILKACSRLVFERMEHSAHRITKSPDLNPNILFGFPIRVNTGRSHGA